MDVRPDEGMEGGVFAPYGGKYEGSGRDRGLTPFPRTSEEQGSKIQKRGAESTREGMGYHQEIGHRTGIVARIPMSSPHKAAEAIDPIVIYNPPPNSQFNYEVPNLRSLGYLVEFVIFFNNSFDLNIS